MNIPHNIEAERALLHQLIFEAIESIHREGRNPDMISVSEWLASSRHKNVEPYDVAQLMSVEVNS